jgi:hypothetical protein
MATIDDLEELQDGISATIQTLLKAYDRCADPVESATILIQTKQLAAQMSQIETGLFHEQTTKAGPVIDQAFASAKGYTARLNEMAGNLERISDMIATASKLVAAVTLIVSGLSV